MPKLPADKPTALASVFKAYDIRGKVYDQLTPAFAYALGQAIARTLRPKTVVVGHDARLSGSELGKALIAALEANNILVASIGLCGTEEIYYAAATKGFDAGVMITGSHNPADENGFKIVRKGAIPVDAASGLAEIARATASCPAASAASALANKASKVSFRPAYLDWLIQYTGIQELAGTTPIRIVADAGNGSAGPVLQALSLRLPFELVLLNVEPDGAFPNGVPNPLLPERRESAARAVREQKADFGIAFDGDFDRCFFFTADGMMVESCYLIGPMAAELLRKNKGATIVHDTRVYWLTQELVLKAGGKTFMSKGGHSCMKKAMRGQNALFGGEMSAHFFYRDFAFCDSGMLTFLLLTALLLRSGHTLAELVQAGLQSYPVSGEINFKVADVAATLARVLAHYGPKANSCNQLDGLDLQFDQWRFSLRGSNTEPLLRLNLETKANQALLAEKTEELKKFIMAQAHLRCETPGLLV